MCVHTKRGGAEREREREREREGEGDALSCGLMKEAKLARLVPSHPELEMMVVLPLSPPLIHAGVHSVRVALLAEKADITYNDSQVSPEALAEEIRRMGFGAEVLSQERGLESGSIDLEVRNAAQ